MTATETKDRILDAAARLFHEQGYHATGISTILREAGVNAGSLYHFFPSKEALLAGVLERYTHLLRPVVMNPVEAQTNDPIERVFILLAQYRQWLSPIGFAIASSDSTSPIPRATCSRGAATIRRSARAR